MVLCCKDSTIFSLSPHLCATDFPDKEHSHDFLLFFRSSSPLSVLTLVASRAAHLTFRPFLLAFVKATAHLLRKTRELFGKTPQLLAKSSLVFRNSRAPFHLLYAQCAQLPHFLLRSILFFCNQCRFSHTTPFKRRAKLTSSTFRCPDYLFSFPHMRLPSHCIRNATGFRAPETVPLKKNFR